MRLWACVTVCICLSLVLTGCHSSALLHDPSYNPPVYFGTHVVQRGDTLYSIARRYGREFSELADANAIRAPYVIHPGQKINLELRGRTQKIVANSTPPRPVHRSNVTESKPSNNPGYSVTKNKNAKNIKDINWRWPHLGPILAKYSYASGDGKSSLGNKGIDIAGALGDPVYAAASGEVVYSGSGLLGYGNLVIITHDDRYLSAYAHNRRNLVTEGQQVKQGQVIAELGNTGADRPKLHFEIRRDGQPTDPLKYLPLR